MSNANPTALRIGLTGLLDGRRYTVLGRVVLSVEVDGETYYWNEFFLGDSSGLELTLVFEETEDGPEWKVFKFFEPTRPLTAREAAAQRVGDQVDFGGKTGRVSLVDQSTVRHIEGAAPGGTELGDVAHFFNADYSDRMVVVSWTGEEVEYYDGGPISAQRIEEAFKLPRSESKSFAGESAGLLGGWKINMSSVVTVVLIGLAILLWVTENFDPTKLTPRAPPPRSAAPAMRLGLGAHGMIDGHRHTVTGYALVDVGRLGKRFNRHEYVLTDGIGKNALLIQGLNGRPAEWHLFRAEVSTPGISSFEAAELRAGRSVEIQGSKMQVTQLFLSTARTLEGRTATAYWPGKTLYGFVAKDKDVWLVARWSEASLRIYSEGRWLAEKDVLAALGQVP